jgi:hypothetical protein
MSDARVLFKDDPGQTGTHRPPRQSSPRRSKQGREAERAEGKGKIMSHAFGTTSAASNESKCKECIVSRKPDRTLSTTVTLVVLGLAAFLTSGCGPVIFQVR